MSDALKRLDEIEERVKAATPGPWEYLTDTRVLVQEDTGQVITACVDEVPPSIADAALIAHAPADLALLARLVRSVAEAPCARGCEDDCEAAIAKGLRQAPPCHSCRIRRELSGGAR